MSDVPATIFQTCQISPETTPGTAVPATKKLQSLSIEWAPKVETKKFRPMGNKFASLVVPGKEWTEAKLSGLATYTELIYPLASVLAYAAPVQQGGTAAYKWTFAPSTSRPDAHKTFTVESGTWLRAWRMAGMLVRGLSLDITRESFELSGDALARAITDDIRLSTNAQYTLTAGVTPPTTGTFTLTFGGQTTSNIAHNATAAAVETALEALSTIGAGNVEVTATVAEGAGNLSVAGNVYTIEFVNDLAQAPRTLTGTFTSLDPSGSIALASSVAGVTPTEIELVPVLPTEVDIYLSRTSHADLDAAEPMESVISIGYEVGDRYAPFWPIGTANGKSFKTTVETEPSAMVTIKLAADDEGMSFLGDVEEGDTVWMRIEAIGDVIEDPYYYTLTIDAALKVENVNEPGDEDGVFAIEYELSFVHDATWGKATQVEVTNKLTAL